MNKNVNLALLVIFCLAGAVGIIAHPTYVAPYLVIVSTGIAYVGLVYAAKRPYMGSTLLGIYYMLVTPLQYILSYIQPRSIIAANYNKYYDIWMFADNDLMLQYFTYATLFYFMGLFVVAFVERCVFRRRTRPVAYAGYSTSIETTRTVDERKIISFPMVWLTLSTLADFMLRQDRISGVLSYFLYGWSVFNLASVVVNHTKTTMRRKDGVMIVLALIIYALPGIMVGRRSYVISGLFITIVYMVTVKKSEIVEIIRKRKALVIVLVVGFLIAFGLANMTKFGVFNPLGLFVSRITGLFDGSSILDYQRSHHVNLGLNNYFWTAYNESGVRANKFYTKTIIGYPSWAATSCAAPIFISSLLYGKLGFIGCTILFTAIFGVATKITNVAYRSLNRGQMDTFSKYKSFISADAVYVAYINYFLDGNIEVLKNLITPIVAWCLFLAFWTFRTGGRVKWKT